MAITAPYYRISRPFLGTEYSDMEYLIDPRNAPVAPLPSDLIRGYHYLEQDLLHFFEFVEPADDNRDCFSHRLYAMLLRASTEFETNARAILSANGYAGRGDWNIKDYYKVNQATRLSDYRVTIPIWAGPHKTIKPFSEWATGHSLGWYQDYNSVKHHRSVEFDRATLENVRYAPSAVYLQSSLASSKSTPSIRTTPSVPTSKATECIRTQIVYSKLHQLDRGLSMSITISIGQQSVGRNLHFNSSGFEQ